MHANAISFLKTKSLLFRIAIFCSNLFMCLIPFLEYLKHTIKHDCVLLPLVDMKYRMLYLLSCVQFFADINVYILYQTCKGGGLWFNFEICKNDKYITFKNVNPSFWNRYEQSAFKAAIHDTQFWHTVVMYLSIYQTNRPTIFPFSLWYF